MRKLLVYLICGAIGALLLANANMAPASELVYTPISPSFGGNPLHGQWLLNLAEAQNRFTNEPFDPVAYFERTLTRRMFSRLVKEVYLGAFGDDTVQVGQYQIANYTVDVSTDGDFITVLIVDSDTGDSTTIQVPYYPEVYADQ